MNEGGVMMVGLISIFVPAFVAVGVYEKIDGSKLTTRQFILYYLFFLTIMLFFNEFLLTYIFHHEERILLQQEFTNLFAAKYLGLSIVEMFVFPYFSAMLQKNIEIKLEVGKVNEKKRNS